MTIAAITVVVVLDPFMLLALASDLPVGSLKSCPGVTFVMSDHLLPNDFPVGAYDELRRIILREQIDLLPASTMVISSILDVPKMKQALLLHQISSIAVAMQAEAFLASECPGLRRRAAEVLKPSAVLCKTMLLQQFNLK